MKKIIYCSFALSILQSILFWNKNLGISMILFIVPTILVILYNLKENQKIKNKNGIYWSIPIILLGLTYFIFNNKFFQILNIPIILSLIIIMCMNITDGNILENKFIRRILSNIFKPFYKFKEIFEKMRIKEIINEQKENQDEKIEFIKKLGKALLIAVPVILIVIILLSSADSVFGNLFHNIPNYISRIFESEQLVNIILRVIWIIVVFLYISGFILVFTTSNEDKVDLKDENREQKVSTFTLNTILISLNIIYLIFSIIQFKYLFINAGKEINFDYATYARSGFFQLMFVSFINFIVLKASKLKQEEKLNTILKIILVIFTILIIISAAFRMHLYEKEYGYTYLRLFVYFILITESLVLLPILMKYIGKDIDVFKTSLKIIVAMYVILNFVNIDSIIAKNNINKYLEDPENNKLDVSYITAFTGTDAINEKVKILNQTSDGLSQESAERLEYIKDSIKSNLRIYKTLYINSKSSIQELNLSKCKIQKTLKYLDLDPTNDYSNRYYDIY